MVLPSDQNIIKNLDVSGSNMTYDMTIESKVGQDFD